jgi:hypothetical protein
VYWDTTLVMVAGSYGICFEIFKNALRHCPGVARSIQRMLFAVFAIALTYAASDLLHFHGRIGPVTRAAAKFALYLTCLEAAFLVIMLWLFGRYRISLGRNLLGLVAGFSLWVGVDVIVLYCLFLPDKTDLIGLRRLMPIAFLLSLTIWCASLWRRHPEPSQPLENELERDYELVKTSTKTALGHLSARTLKVFRP